MTTRHNPVAGLVNFGASLPVRVLQGLIMRATALLGSKSTVVPAQVDDEAAAFAWIAAHRPRAD